MQMLSICSKRMAVYASFRSGQATWLDMGPTDRTVIPRSSTSEAPTDWDQNIPLTVRMSQPSIQRMWIFYYQAVLCCPIRKRRMSIQPIHFFAAGYLLQSFCKFLQNAMQAFRFYNFFLSKVSINRLRLGWMHSLWSKQIENEPLSASVLWRTTDEAFLHVCTKQASKQMLTSMECLSQNAAYPEHTRNVRCKRRFNLRQLNKKVNCPGEKCNIVLKVFPRIYT